MRAAMTAQVLEENSSHTAGDCGYHTNWEAGGEAQPVGGLVDVE